MSSYQAQILQLPINPAHANMENHLDMVVIEVPLECYYPLERPTQRQKVPIRLTILLDDSCHDFVTHLCASHFQNNN